MCLLITLFAAVIATILWYVQIPNYRKISTLGFIYWGASLMWLVDALFCIAEGEPFLDMSLNDALLGLTVVLCGLLAWAILLCKSNMYHWFKN